jgi:molecular chaperone GrpE
MQELVMIEHDASENVHDEHEDIDIDEMDTEAMKKALEDEKARAETNLDGWKRAQADFINFKRRVEQEREEIIKSANAGLVCNILPVLDDMERALDSMPDHLAEDPWVEGVKLIERKLRSQLEVQGLCKIDAVGEPFDPYLHEAVRQDKGKEGVVVEEVLKGYKFNDRVIRPSKVIVGTGENGDEEAMGQGEKKEE